jgi:hypothetical protein
MLAFERDHNSARRARDGVPRRRSSGLARQLRSRDLDNRQARDVSAWVYDINALNGERAENAEVKADVRPRRDGRALPWLVAAMMFLAPDDPDAAEAIASGDRCQFSAYYTLA